MCGFYVQLWEGIDDLLRDDVRDFLTRKKKLLKLRATIKQAAKELYNDFFERYQNDIYYDALDKYIKNNNVISMVIKECKSLSALNKSSVEKLAAEHANRFTQRYDRRYSIYENEIKKLLSKLFNDAFNKINEIEDPELQKAVNIIVNCLNSSLKGIETGVDEIKEQLGTVIKNQNDFLNEQKDKTTEMTSEEFKEKIHNAFKYQKNINPSTKYNDTAKELLPTGNVIERDITATVNGEEKQVLLQEYLKKTWERTTQLHISVTGIGGIGKTVVLLDTVYPETADVLYIPLRKLAVSEDDSKVNYIEKFIKENTLASDESAYKCFLRRCIQPWEKGPNIIIILDGLNEVSAPKLRSIIREVESNWSCKPGIQLIMTSRYDISHKVDVGNIASVLIEPLSRDIIEKYLTSRELQIPDVASRVWEVIDTPLMLRLYAESETIKKTYNNDFAKWRESINAGSILWNYLESELSKADIENILEGVVAIHFVAPFVCYKMMEKNEFDISEETFRRYISDAVKLYEKQTVDETLPDIILKAIAQVSTSQIDKNKFYSLLLNNFHLFDLADNGIQLIHQHFRDCLAAMYIIQTAENAISMPLEWTKPFDFYVTEFISELLITESAGNGKNTWQKVWNMGEQKKKDSHTYTQKMLELYKKAYGMDISDIDFANTDLSKIFLTPFVLTDKSKKHFQGAQIDIDTFLGKGHGDTVCAVSWSCDGKSYISASHDCDIRIYNADDDRNTMLEKQHLHYIRCAEFSPVSSEIIASAGDDKELLVWNLKTVEDENGRSIKKWVHEKWGECSEWIRGLAWSADGKRIVCGDGSGKIKLFDETEHILFERVHKSNVRHIAWSPRNSNILASGSDDGILCVWSDNGKCKAKDRLKSAINSIAWINGGEVLMAATSEKVIFYNVIYKEESGKLKISLHKDKERAGNEISYVAAAAEGDIDYIAIFGDRALEILSISYKSGEFTTNLVGAYRYENKTNKIISAEWNNSRDTLICGSRDGSVSKIAVLKNEEDKERIIFNEIGKRCSKAARCSCWSPDGKWLAAGYDDSRIRIWDVFGQKCLAVLSGHEDSVKCVAWSPDGRKVVSGADDGTVRVWSGESINSMSCKALKEHQDSVNTVMWLKNDTIVFGGDNGRLTVINSHGEEIKQLDKVHYKRIYSISASSDERFIVSGGNDKFLCIWDMDTGRYTKYRSEHTKPVRAVAWSKNGNFIITSSNDCTINKRSIDMKNKKILKDSKKFPQMHNDFIYGAAISGNDAFAVGGSTDSTVGFWRVSDLSFVHKSDAHKGFIWNVSSSPEVEGRYYVATSSSDGNVKIWDVTDQTVSAVEPSINLPVICETNIVGCDFSGAVINDDELRKLIIANGGVITE